MVRAIQDVMSPVSNSIYMRQDRLEAALARVLELKARASELCAKDWHYLSACNEVTSMLISAEMFFRAAMERKEIERLVHPGRLPADGQRELAEVDNHSEQKRRDDRVNRGCPDWEVSGETLTASNITPRRRGTMSAAKGRRYHAHHQDRHGEM